MRLLMLLLLLCLSLPAWALSSDWAGDTNAGARLISSAEGTGDDGSVLLGLEVRLGEGWHTYWRSPGEAGLPPQLDWKASENDSDNVQSATLSYPAPQRYTAYGLETIGYRDHVLFPIKVDLRQKNMSLHAGVAVDLLVCSSLCVPKHFDLSLTVPAGPATPGPETEAVQQALAGLPATGKDAAIKLQDIRHDGASLLLTFTSGRNFSHPDLFVENTQAISFAPPDISVDPENGRLVVKLSPADQLPDSKALDALQLVLTVVDGDQAAEIQTTTPAAGAEQALVTPVTTPPPLKLGAALLLALLGGLILNLMPCVLPVLSLKILGVVRHGGGSRHLVRQSFMITASGIIFSFLLLAAVTAALKNLGLSLGWGVQFQQPVFLVFLILLLTLFACNLLDWFDIPLPRFLSDRLSRAYHPRLAGDFATGALATLLATPCSAPFLGTAVGFALAGTVGDIFLIFAGLGCGMALPYLAVAAFPRVATLLPKPGIWMIRLRHFLGAALALTAVWLLWVLTAQTNLAQTIALSMAMIALAGGLAARKSGLTAKLLIICIVSWWIVANLLANTAGAQTFFSKTASDQLWTAYDPDALNLDVAEGKTVLLDVTAGWCLTCKANMKLALTRPEVEQRLWGKDVVAMRADWTNPDPAIAELLHRYNRYGIPFNIVYGPAAPGGILLPELLTPKLVVDALAQASQTGAP